MPSLSINERVFLADALLGDAAAISELQNLYERKFGPNQKRTDRVSWRVALVEKTVIGAYSYCDDERHNGVRTILDFYVCEDRYWGTHAAYAMARELCARADEEKLTLLGFVNPQNGRFAKPLAFHEFFPVGILVSRAPQEAAGAPSSSDSDSGRSRHNGPGRAEQAEQSRERQQPQPKS